MSYKNFGDRAYIFALPNHPWGRFGAVRQHDASNCTRVLDWDRRVNRERETRFVELGAIYAGQYWQVENLKSFDEFLERPFPEITAHGQLPDDHPRAPAKIDSPRFERGRVDKGSLANKSSALGPAAL